MVRVCSSVSAVAVAPFGTRMVVVAGALTGAAVGGGVTDAPDLPQAARRMVSAPSQRARCGMLLPASRRMPRPCILLPPDGDRRLGPSSIVYGDWWAMVPWGDG